MLQAGKRGGIQGICSSEEAERIGGEEQRREAGEFGLGRRFSPH